MHTQHTRRCAYHSITHLLMDRYEASEDTSDSDTTASAVVRHTTMMDLEEGGDTDLTGLLHVEPSPPSSQSPPSPPSRSTSPASAMSSASTACPKAHTSWADLVVADDGGLHATSTAIHVPNHTGDGGVDGNGAALSMASSSSLHPLIMLQPHLQRALRDLKSWGAGHQEGRHHHDHDRDTVDAFESVLNNMNELRGYCICLCSTAVGDGGAEELQLDPKEDPPLFDDDSSTVASIMSSIGSPDQSCSMGDASESAAILLPTIYEGEGPSSDPSSPTSSPPAAVADPGAWADSEGGRGVGESVGVAGVGRITAGGGERHGVDSTKLISRSSGGGCRNLSGEGDGSESGKLSGGGSGGDGEECGSGDRSGGGDIGDGGDIGGGHNEAAALDHDSPPSLPLHDQVRDEGSRITHRAKTALRCVHCAAAPSGLCTGCRDIFVRENWERGRISSATTATLSPDRQPPRQQRHIPPPPPPADLGFDAIAANTSDHVAVRRPSTYSEGSEHGSRVSDAARSTLHCRKCASAPSGMCDSCRELFTQNRWENTPEDADSRGGSVTAGSRSSSRASMMSAMVPPSPPLSPLMQQQQQQQQQQPRTSIYSATPPTAGQFVAISPPLGPLPPPDDRSAPVDVHYLQGNMSAMRRNLSSVSTTNLSMTTALSKQKSTILLQQEQINALARDMLLLKAEREQTGREDGRGGNGENVGGGARGGGKGGGTRRRRTNSKLSSRTSSSINRANTVITASATTASSIGVLSGTGGGASRVMAGEEGEGEDNYTDLSAVDAAAEALLSDAERKVLASERAAAAKKAAIAACEAAATWKDQQTATLEVRPWRSPGKIQQPHGTDFPIVRAVPRKSKAKQAAALVTKSPVKEMIRKSNRAATRMRNATSSGGKGRKNEKNSSGHAFPLPVSLPGPTVDRQGGVGGSGVVGAGAAEGALKGGGGDGKTRVGKRKGKKKRTCPAEGCTVNFKLSNSFKCDRCGMDVCLGHRYPRDHQCLPSAQLAQSRTNGNGL